MADNRRDEAVDIIARRFITEAASYDEDDYDPNGPLGPGWPNLLDRIRNYIADLDPTDDEYDAAVAYLTGGGSL